MITPIAMAAMAIFIIGAEMLLLYFLVLISLLAIKNSKFKTFSMVKILFKNTFLFLLITLVSCGRSSGQNKEAVSTSKNKPQQVVVGANRTSEYLPLLKDKKVGIVGNQSSVIFNSAISEGDKATYTHLVDSLVTLKVNIKRVFAPEHGFRGNADAGEHVKDGKDPKTGLNVISLYGDNKKPKPEQLKDLDILIFDIQDVGARFYTYISSLHYVMEACAENDVKLIILDRPNPNGHYVDGPVLNPEFQSFVRVHPVPVVHGLTMGEYATMINGEKWLENEVQCDLTVIKLDNYTHQTEYSLPIKPSPNLPNDKAINLYPSLCFFEGTNVNAGRGTDNQFQVFGSPSLSKTYFDYNYILESKDGAKSPKHLGETCYGRDLTKTERLDHINLSWLIEAYNNTNSKSGFFNNFFSKLAGGNELQNQIESGLSEKEIRASWQPGLEKFNKIRDKYLLYK